MVYNATIPGEGGRTMLGGCRAAPSLTGPAARMRKANIMEDKEEALQKLIAAFAPEERDRIIEILRLALEIVHSPLNR